LALDRCFAQGQHAKRDERGVEIFALMKTAVAGVADSNLGRHTDARYKRARSTRRALQQFVERVGGREDWPG